MGDSTMKLVCYFTPAHKSMFDRFLKKSCDLFGEHEIVARMDNDQLSADGSFYSKGFHETVVKKMDFIIGSNSWDDSQYCIFSDADVIFTAPTQDYLLENVANHDIVFQSDQTTHNSGFYVFRNNAKVKAMFEEAVRVKDQHFGDQLCINAALQKVQLKHKAFDKNIFNISFYTRGEVWDNQSTIHFPKHMRVYHANFIVGVENKEKALQTAHDRFIAPKFPNAPVPVLS